MDSKFTNSDLVGATLKIYNEFSSKQKTTIAIKKERDINKNKSVISKNNIPPPVKPLLLTKEVVKNKGAIQLKNILNESLLENEKISNNIRIKKYYKKKKEFIKLNQKLPILKLNKIIKFEKKNYLLLHRIVNSDLKIIKMKSF